MINPIYNLPELNFVGGESQTFLFNLLTASGASFDASSCDVAFAVVSYANKTGNPLFSKKVTVSEGDGGVLNLASVELLPLDTVSLYGRYVYQLTITDIDGNTEIPGQGIMNITRNIHHGAITG